MIKQLIVLIIGSKVTDTCNRYILEKVTAHLNDPREYAQHAMAVGAYSLSIKLCDIIGIDREQIYRPEDIIAKRRKEVANGTR